jgi:hypothetical protein
LPTSNEALVCSQWMKRKKVKRDKAIKKLHEEFAKFEITMQELCFLRRVANDLKSYRRMVKLKRYD